MFVSATLPVRQTGAIGLFAILTLLLAILFAALAVDTGRLLMEERRLQTVADMAALDASSVAGSCGSGNLADVEVMAAASAARNNYSGLPLDVAVGEIDVGAGGVRQFTPTAIEQATSVSVTASKSVPASFFAGGIFGNQTTLQANAVAGREAIAGFSAGSMLLSIPAETSDEQNNVLNALMSGALGGEVSLVSYEGLLNADITIQDIIDTNADIGTVNEFLNTNFTLAEAFSLFAAALGQSDTATVEAQTELDTLLNAAIRDQSLSFENVLDVTTENPEDAAEATLNLFDLINTTVLVANGDSFITLDELELDLGVGDVSAQLDIITPPKIAIGPPGKNANGNWITEASTAQFDLILNIEINSNEVIPSLDLKLVLDAKLTAVQGKAWLESIQCASAGSPDTIVNIGGNSGILDPLPEIKATIDISALGLPLINGIEITSANTGTNDDQSEAGNLSFSVGELPQTDSINGLGLESLTANSLKIEELGTRENCAILDLTCLLAGITAPILQIVNDLDDEAGIREILLRPIINDLQSELIVPLLEILGIQVGAMQVTLFDVQVDRPEMKR